MVNPIVLALYGVILAAVGKNFGIFFRAVLVAWAVIPVSAGIAGIFDERFVGVHIFGILDLISCILLVAAFSAIAIKNAKAEKYEARGKNKSWKFFVFLFVATLFCTAMFYFNADDIFPPSNITIIH